MHDLDGLGLKTVGGKGPVPWHTDFAEYGFELPIRIGHEIMLSGWAPTVGFISRRVSSAPLGGAFGGSSHRGAIAFQ
jgi:hypothetical protein